MSREAIIRCTAREESALAYTAETDYFMDLSLVDDPYPFFEYLRAQGPVRRLPAHNTIAVLGFEEALAVYRR